MDQTVFQNAVQNESDHLWHDVFPRISPGEGEGAPLRDRRLPSYAETLWWLGWADGGLGQSPEEGEALVQIHATAVRRSRLQELSGEKVRLEKDVEVADAAGSHLEDEIKSTQEELRDLSERRRKDPHEMSLVTGLIYLLVALVLILADMPLSLRLVADGFDMPVEYTVPGTNQTITFGDLFNSTTRADALIHLWEPIVLALGIAALGIFFKIVADYLLSTAPLLNAHPRLLKILKAVFFTAAFLLMVTGLYFVGQLRAAQQSASLARKSQTAPAGSFFSMQGASAASATTAAPAPAATTSGSTMQKEVDWWARWSFVLMAITLPTIGGICFSIGWKRIQLGLLRFTRFFWLEWLWRRLKRHREGAARLHERLAAVAAELDAIANTRLDEVAPLKLYMHGYLRGFTGPQRLEPHRTLHARCKELLHFWVAAGMQERNIDRIPKVGGGAS